MNILGGVVIFIIVVCYLISIEARLHKTQGDTDEHNRRLGRLIKKVRDISTKLGIGVNDVEEEEKT